MTARVLDEALELALGRLGTLAACATIGWAPIYLVGLALAALVTAEVPPVALELALLGLGTVAALAWLLLCWSHAAALLVCAAELAGERLELGTAFRRALGRVPRAALAAATRLLLTALGLLPLGLGLPVARVLTGAVGPVAVLEDGPLALGLARSRQAAGPLTIAHLAVWLGFVLFLANAVLGWVLISPWLGEAAAGMLEALEAGNAVLLLAGLASLLVVEPYRVAALALAWRHAQEREHGHDLLARLGRLAVVLVLLVPGAVRAESAEDWRRAVSEARDSVLAADPSASGRVAVLEGLEVELGTRDVRVTDPMLTVLAEGVQLGDEQARRDAARHLASLEREAHALVEAAPLPDDVDTVAAVAAGTQGAASPPLTLARGRLQAWLAGLRGGERGPFSVVAGSAVLAGGALALVLLLRREVGPLAPRVAPPVLPLAPEHPPDGSLRYAVRGRFLALLAQLEQRGLVVRPGTRTNGQIAALLPPGVTPFFREAAEVFERTWYGEQAATAGDLASVERALQVLEGA